MIAKKYLLNNILSGLKSVLVAFSGGVDSTFLLKSAIDKLGAKNILAVIATSETYPEHEKNEAIVIAQNLGANYLLVETKEFNDKNFRNNPENRCYFCKKELFSILINIARENKINFVCDGSNADDLSDFRPGAIAKKELGIRSPLQEAGLTKAEIRKLSKQLGLPTWDKPSYACLASRIPYGEKITKEALKAINDGESYLRSLGFRQLRVRHHGNLARIEVEKTDIHKIIGQDFINKITKKFEELGYLYVTIDLKGYRIGSMNEVLR